jgi:hypothetical protein
MSIGVGFVLKKWRGQWQQLARTVSGVLPTVLAAIEGATVEDRQH